MTLTTDDFRRLSREAIATPLRKPVFRYRRTELRAIADRFKLAKRRKFYELAAEQAEQYFFDRLAEEDLLSASHAKEIFTRSAKLALRLLEESKPIFEHRATFSLWNEPYFVSTGHIGEIAVKFKRDEFQEQLVAFMVLTLHAAAELPEAKPSRKKMLALRRWALGHLLFWRDELRRPVTVCNDPRDGQSETQSFLADLLQPIDPSSASRLRTVLRDLGRDLREKTPSR